MKSTTRPNPHPEYKMLVRQFNASLNLNESLRDQLSYYQKKDYANSERRIAQLERELESQREMNEILTNELEVKG